MKRYRAIVLVCAAVGISAIPAAAEASSMGNPNIVQLAASTPQLSTLVTLVKSAGLVKALSGPGKLTVFAPTNAAFAKVPKTTLNTLAHNKKMLASVLEYHVVKGVLNATAVEQHKMLMTLEGTKLTVKVKSGNVYIDQAKVIKPNVMASNGVVHLINAVLIPSNG